MSVRLRDALATTESLAAVFSDASILQAMLDFESALARAQARTGVIPQPAAEAIAAAARAENFDASQLSKSALRAGTLAIPLVKLLTERVRAADPSAAGFVHWGATSQDVTDTALVLLLQRAREIFAADHARIRAGLRKLSDTHAATPMLARTLLQPAPPTTFGLKAAGWFAALERGWQRVETQFEECRILQFGGASGTLASLADRGPAVAVALAEELSLALPEAPWHSHRDRLAALLCALAVYTGSLGKMARDVELLMQYEVSEASEPGGDGRGGSSTMPHKKNPTACSIALACVNRISALAASYLAALPHEHERAAGAWHAEWSTIPDAVEAAGLALESMREVAEGLTVDATRMRVNLDATNGLVFAERAMMLLGPALGRDAAHKLMTEAALRVGQSGRRLTEVLSEMLQNNPGAARALTPEILAGLEAPENYLGSAEHFRRQLLKTKS